MADDDIVRDIIDLFLREFPDVDVEKAYKVECDARAIWGGCRVYVPRDPRRRARNDAAVHAWKNGVPISRVSESLGIDRTTLYRLLKRRP